MRVSIVVSALLAWCSIAHGQQLDVVADVVQFRGSSGTDTRWELHYSFSDTTLRYVLAPTGFVAEMLCSLTVKRDTAVVAQDVWIASAQSPVSNPAHSRFFSGFRSLSLPTGTYSVNFEASDIHNPSKRTATSFTSQVLGVSSRPAMSDVMFVMPKRATSDTRFLRAGQPCDPNPRHELSGGLPILGIYAEFYNAKLAGLDTFYVELSILNNVRDEEFTTYIPMIASSNDLAIREDVELENLATGIYTVRLRYLDNSKLKAFDVREERMFIINPERLPEQQRLISDEEDFMSSEWSITTGDKLKLELELSEVLATKAEIETKNLCSDERSQQRFLYRFWKQRDPDESTPANERLDQFRKMYKHAQTFYRSVMFKDGWKSDRGRVLLMYGQPTILRQFPSTFDHKPIEIWVYQHLQGGTDFCFVDINLQQEYKLVHSTVIGWIFEPNWYKLYAMVKHPMHNDVNPANQLLPEQDLLPYIK